MEPIKDMNILRTYLHQHIYNAEIINTLIDYINTGIDVFTIQNIDESKNSVLLKIKKMNMKKLPSYSNDVLFYYNIFNNGFIKLIQSIEPSDNMIKDIIYCLLHNQQNVNLLYNINVIDDSNIVLYL